MKGVLKMKPYKMIRSKAQEARCKNDGRALYCDCGCQIPQESDPDINLEGVNISQQHITGYADFDLVRNGENCGCFNTQYNYLILNGIEFLGVKRNLIHHLREQAFELKTRQQEQTGDTLIETYTKVKTAEQFELQEQDGRNYNNTGYCTRCHSYCYGDCEA
jgi:hypothetical protein